MHGELLSATAVRKLKQPSVISSACGSVFKRQHNHAGNKPVHVHVARYPFKGNDICNECFSRFPQIHGLMLSYKSAKYRYCERRNMYMYIRQALARRMFSVNNQKCCSNVFITTNVCHDFSCVSMQEFSSSPVPITVTPIRLMVFHMHSLLSGYL